MYLLFETICIQNGAIQNRRYHENRFLKSYTTYYNKTPSFGIFDFVKLSSLKPNIKYKLKIRYNERESDWVISEYLNKIPVRLQVVIDNQISYRIKFLDRKKLNELHDKRNNAEDVLILKKGLVTDASYANIILKKDNLIATPKEPLLKGTCRSRIIKEFAIEQKDIKLHQIHHFTHFQLINAMNDYDENRWVSTKHIILPN